MKERRKKVKIKVTEGEKAKIGGKEERKIEGKEKGRENKER